MVADSLEALRGPESGTIELPLRLFWSGSSDAPEQFNLEARYDALAAYQYVLGEARSVGDLTGYLNARLLERLWPSLRLPPAIRRAWEAAHPGLARLPAGQPLAALCSLYADPALPS
jgi:hypothetical protein